LFYSDLLVLQLEAERNQFLAEAESSPRPANCAAASESTDTNDYNDYSLESLLQMAGLDQAAGAAGRGGRPATAGASDSPQDTSALSQSEVGYGATNGVEGLQDLELDTSVLSQSEVGYGYRLEDEQGTGLVGQQGLEVGWGAEAAGQGGCVAPGQALEGSDPASLQPASMEGDLLQQEQLLDRSRSTYSPSILEPPKRWTRNSEPAQYGLQQSVTSTNNYSDKLPSVNEDFDEFMAEMASLPDYQSTPVQVK
jgi:hypothetical protein